MEGKVIIPEGIWLTGPIELLSNVNLYTKQNALVLFTGDFEAYPIIATSFEGLRLVVANRRFPHAMQRISLSPDMVHLTETATAGVQ